ncbi:MAG: hypothetical protein CM15mP15_2570 [Prochlorococcus sp.]|nr:MAG: hypothetical protein CM15mP15_2570 [Prochlorococcus sp.]
MNIVSRILLREIVNILKKTKNSPNQPRITAIDKNFNLDHAVANSIIHKFKCHSTLKKLLIQTSKKHSDIFLVPFFMGYLIVMFNKLIFIYNHK